MQLQRLHWFLALGLALGAHLSLVALFHSSPASGARGIGTGGIEISLGPASRAAGPPDTELVAEEVAPEVEPVQEPESEIVRPPELTEAPADLPPPVEEVAPPIPKPESKPRQTKSVQKTETKPKPRPAHKNTKQTQKTAMKSGDNGTSTLTINGDNTAGGGNPGLRADYFAQLQAWLEQYRRYPRWAQRRGQEGTALLYFTIDRNGNVLDYRIERSTGHTILDREVTAMLERAKPLPPVPAQLRQARLELLLPIQFSLR